MKLRTNWKRVRGGLLLAGLTLLLSVGLYSIAPPTPTPTAQAHRIAGSITETVTETEAETDTPIATDTETPTVTPTPTTDPALWPCVTSLDGFSCRQYLQHFVAIHRLCCDRALLFEASRFVGTYDPIVVISGTISAKAYSPGFCLASWQDDDPQARIELWTNDLCPEGLRPDTAFDVHSAPISGVTCGPFGLDTCHLIVEWYR
jgi:hypothetical protein